MQTTNVTLVGVGGQGILLTADVLARAAAAAGFEVKKSEIHGMSQRGGSVSSEVRFGGNVLSPVVPSGETDVLVAFDVVEAIRAFPQVRPAGRALVDRKYVVPVTVSSGMQPPPDDPEKTLSGLYAGRLARIDSDSLAREAGNPRTANMAIAGALSTLLPIPEEAWDAALRGRIPAKLLEPNLRAFALGRAAAMASAPEGAAAQTPPARPAPKTARAGALMAALAALFLSAGCATHVQFSTEPEGALVRYRGEGRATFRWKTAPTPAPADVETYYGRISAYAVWPDGTVSATQTVSLSPFRPEEKIVLRRDPSLRRRAAVVPEAGKR